jgi:hypothetical protein
LEIEVHLPLVLKPVAARTQSGGGGFDLRDEDFFAAAEEASYKQKRRSYDIKDVHRDSGSVDRRISGRL